MFRIVELNRTQKLPHVSICSCYNFDVCAIFSPFHQLAGGNHIMHKVRMPMVQRAQFATPPFVANKQQRTNFRKKQLNIFVPKIPETQGHGIFQPRTGHNQAIFQWMAQTHMFFLSQKPYPRTTCFQSSIFPWQEFDGNCT